MTDAAGRHSQPSGTIRVTVAAPVTGPVTRQRRDPGDREEIGDGYFASLAKARYLLLTTFKPKGTPVSAVVQGIADGDRAYFRVRSRSGTSRRLRHTDGVHVAPCRALGLWSNGPPLDAAARPLADEEASGVAGQLDRKYPVSRRSLARLLQRARRRRLAYYELLLRESIARTLTPRISQMCNGETGRLVTLGSAEVIAEAPSDGTGAVLPLSNFGTVSFTNATVDNTAMGNENPGALTMVSAGDVTEATPSALTGGNAFTVTWDSSGVTATATVTGSTADVRWGGW
jgi:PPOX class probable F420-dependent enzyme